ncbi:hypothetical protein [Zooshikella sp. RANM57]|uniref:hypothetical protein n=1 Tax=Zooshikella sp. RANM57 TaxID=3425863 RepID=UPI003D6EB574
MNSKAIVDFDLFRINDVSLCNSYDLGGKNSGVIKCTSGGWYVCVENKIVESIFICLRNGYQGYSRFNGIFVKDGCEIKLSTKSTPEEIDLIFGEPVEFFEDEVSINRRYKLREFFVEFDWGTQGAIPDLRYLSIDNKL